MRLKILQPLLFQNEHAGWSIFHQIVTRCLMVIKFFLAARLLGPEAVGLVAIAILSLAIVEALTDTGLQQAVIQNEKRLESIEAGALWTLQAIRGGIVFWGLLFLSVQLARLLSAPNASSLIQAAAFISIIRNAVNPGPSLMLRDRNFRGIAVYEVAASLTDLLTTIVLIFLGLGPIAMVIGTASGEAAKLVLSWVPFRIPLTPNIQWWRITHLTNFGKWIWGNSVLTLLLNQLDKILVAKLLGPSDLGFYQTAARICQLMISEPVMALGQYLFPTYANLFRLSPKKAHHQFIKILRLTFVFLFVMVIGVLLLVRPVIGLVLGEAWLEAENLAKFFVFPMTVGATIAIFVPYLRAIAQPRHILYASGLQLLTLAVAAPFLIQKYGAEGMIVSSGLACTISLIYMVCAVNNRSYH